MNRITTQRISSQLTSSRGGTVEIQSLISHLARAESFPEDVGEVEVCQTHISVVFLTERWAYKIKKPVSLDFVDYSTLQKRRHYCEREVELNRRLAQEVYRGVVPVVEVGSGVRIDPSEGEWSEEDVVEWAVKMIRLPDEQTLQSKLRAGSLDVEVLEDLAVKLADFYADARRGGDISEAARFEAVASHIRDNIRAAQTQTGELLHPSVYDELQAAVERELEALQEVIESRAEADIARDTHGDLRLEHVYMRPGRKGLPYVVVDCIEFNDAFRYEDPLCDVAFMAMDLQHEGEWAYARRFIEAYMQECRELGGDAADIAEHPTRPEVRRLMRLYISYRAAVRGKVKGMKATEEEVSAAEREAAGGEAIAYWLHALGALRSPEERPALILVSGLPGVGKSTVAEALSQDGKCRHLDSDIVRKQAAGLSPDEEAPTEPKGGLYADCWSDETYRQLHRRARSELVRGRRVAVEATFRSEARRRPFWELAEELGVPVVMLVCETETEEVERRLRERDSGPSDADVEVYRRLSAEWEPVVEVDDAKVVRVDTTGEPSETIQQARDALRERRLWQ